MSPMCLCFGGELPLVLDIFNQTEKLKADLDCKTILKKSFSTHAK